MQKLMMITDAASMEAANKVLGQEEFELSNLISDGHGRWIAVLDDSVGDLFDDFDEDDDEDED